MAQDVERAVLSALAAHDEIKSDDEAVALLKDLARRGRYVKDVWS